MQRKTLDEFVEKIKLARPEEQASLLALLDKLEEARGREDAQNSFIAFVKKCWPGFIEGRHHKIVADAFERVARGELKRLIINMPPRHSKSEFASYLLPAWFLGKFPDKKIIQSSNTAELATGFGRKVRNLISDPIYQEVFSGVNLAPDSKAAGRWSTNKKGEYFAIGVGGTVSGRGGDIVIIDDPHSEQEARMAEVNSEVFDSVYEWYTSGPRQRLQPGGAIIIVMCVAGGQRVLMGDGTWSPIENVKAGQSVIGYSPSGPVAKTVVDSRCSGEDDLLEVVSNSSSVKVNARHPFLVVRGGLKKSATNQEGVERSRDWGVEWVPAGELRVGDTVVTIKSTAAGVGHRPMAYDDSAQMTQEDYWLFGFLFGDGWLINCNGRGVVGFCVAASDKPKLNSHLLSLIERRWGIHPTLKEEGYYRADSQKLGRWLERMGLCSGAKKKRLPDWVFKLRPSDKRAFLRGFFNADGWLRPSDHAETWTVCLCNRELLDDLRLLARTCGVKCSVIHSSTKRSQPPNSPKEKLFFSHSARFSFKDDKSEWKGRYRYQDGRHWRFEDIKEIKPAGRGLVYDLTVDGVESFIAEGFVVHNTRWGKRDLTGRILSASSDREGSDQWEVIHFPAIMPSGQSLWPEFWSLDELEALKAELPTPKWQAQYQQDPVSEEGAIIKREWWREWPSSKPPECEFIIQAWDTAYEAKQKSDFSACTTWGVFFRNDVANIYLLDAYKERIEFPKLKTKALALHKYWEPDALLIEQKASGPPLTMELRRIGVPVQEYTPVRGSSRNPNTKAVRVNAIADVFASGLVWHPPTKWAEDVIEEFASFPYGENDDLVDSGMIALTRFREGGFISLPSDYEEDDLWDLDRPAKYY